MNGSPIFRDTLAFCGVLLDGVENGASHARLRERLADGALRLLDDITLALAGFEQTERLHGADAELRTLRTHLLLAHEMEIVPEDLFLALAEQADAVGRQIGGWLKSLRKKQAPDG